MTKITIGHLFCELGGGALLVGQLPDGRLVHIEDSVSGLKCGCCCLACGVPLVGKRGAKRIHHFSHSPDHGRPCSSPGETALHKLAKEALLESGFVRLPVIVNRTGHRPAVIAEEHDFDFDQVQLEERRGNVVPDVVCRKGEREIFVEVEVTHPCDQRKIDKLKRMELDVIEIDLSAHRDTPLDEIGELVTVSADRTWLSNKAPSKPQTIPPSRSLIATQLAEAIMESAGCDQSDFDSLGWFGKMASAAGFELAATNQDDPAWEKFIGSLIQLEKAVRGGNANMKNLCGLPLHAALKRRARAR